MQPMCSGTMRAMIVAALENASRKSRERLQRQNDERLRGTLAVG